MEILTGEQMRRIDRRTIEELGVEGLELMETAGRGVAEALLEDYPSAAAVGVLILCGKGNNGGDGLVAARHLARCGVLPRVIVLASGDDLTGDAAVNLARARQAGIEVREAPNETLWDDLAPVLGSTRILVDALLGTGVRGGARGLAAIAIEAINACDASVVSVDLPSGVNADSCDVEGVAVRADRTYTLCRPKLPLVLGPSAAHAGHWSVISIAIPDAAVEAEGSSLEWFDAEAAARLVRPRALESHKGEFGHLLAVAGSRSKSGAAVLLARGALRCGVGLMTVATPASAQERVAVQQAEIMTEALAETADGALGAAAVDAVRTLLVSRDALALGPGLGTDEETVGAVRRIVRDCEAPLVVDADGLNALAAKGAPADCLGPARGRAVLTPHPGEAARLLGRSSSTVQANRLDAVRRLAEQTGSVVVLKGHRTLVGSPDGRVAVNASGNPGMASGGTGDVLTGAVGASLARGRDPWDAARLAVFVHGDAGDRAAARLGLEGLIASDVVAELPAALAALMPAAEDA